MPEQRSGVRTTGIYTLAQSETAHFTNTSQSKEKIITRNGYDLSDDKVWKGRVKRKITSQAMNLELIEAVETKGEPERKQKIVSEAECEEYVYAVEVYNWISEKTGEWLPGYAPTAQIHAILLDNIDTDLQ